MQIKSFSGQSSSAVLAMIKEELGPDAVILDTREEGGVITMTAATDRAPAPRPEAPAAPATFEPIGGQPGRFPASGVPPAAGAGRYREESLVQQSAQAAAAAGNGARPKRKEPPADAARQSAAARAETFGEGGLGSVPPGWQQWHEEWSSIKNHLLALMKPALRFDLLAPRQRLAMEFLQREGVDDVAILQLFQRLQRDPETSILGPLSALVPVRPWGYAEWPQRIQIVSGPFGVGKTSVAVRLALALRREVANSRICLVNADATRGNGRLLLRHYCDLSDMAYKEAATTMELVAAINSAAREGFDRIFVDLPGLARGRYLSTLLADAGLGERTGESADDAAVHLVLPPHFGGMQMKGILERYRAPHAGGIVWTKLDETEHYGQIVNVAVASGLPVTALSFGPGLGNSMAPVRENMLWRLLFKRELPLGG